MSWKYSRRLISMVVVDGTAPICHQDIRNPRDDIARPVHISGVPYVL